VLGEAVQAGETHHAIAEAAGLTRQRVQQIMREQGRS
jgi:predicted transcriptional regulator